jgi:hypothetical protein
MIYDVLVRYYETWCTIVFLFKWKAMSGRPVLPIARAVPAMGHLHGLLMIVKHKELVYSWC